MTTSRKIAIAALLVAIGVLVWDKTRPDGSITQPASAQAHNATTSKPATAPPRLAQQTTPTPSLRPIGPPLMTASSPASKKSTLTPGYPPHQTHPNPCANKTWPPNLPLTLSPPASKPLSTPSVHHKINRSITCPATSSPPLPTAGSACHPARPLRHPYWPGLPMRPPRRTPGLPRKNYRTLGARQRTTR